MSMIGVIYPTHNTLLGDSLTPTPPVEECLLSLGNGSLLDLGNNTFLKVNCVTTNNNLFSVAANELLSVGTEEYMTV